MEYLRILLLFCSIYSILGERIAEKDENGERVGNPDDLAEIVRPCPTFDLNCIRKFFSTHGKCTKSFGPVPDPLIRGQANYYVPRLNVSTTNALQRNTGLNGRVEEFYINKETDNLVIAVEFRNLSVSSDNVYFIFHRRAREAVVTVANSSVNFQSVVVTAIIPNIDDLQIKRAECTAFVNDQNPFVYVGPQAAESSDPQTQTTFAVYPTFNNVIIQELFLTDAFHYIITFIQYNICDFGLYDKV